MIYIFGDFELDEHLWMLRHMGKPLKLEPKVLDILAYLIHHRDRVVSKDELIGQLWPGQVVSEAALTHCIAKARKVVQDDGGKQQIIKTLHGRGYRFVVETTERSLDSLLDVMPDAGAGQIPSPTVPRKGWQKGHLVLAGLLVVLGGVITVWYLSIHLSSSGGRISTGQKLALTLLDKPSLVVLPFISLSVDPEQEYFSKGLTEDLITSLSRISGLFVVARNSVVLYQGQEVDLAQVSRDLGVQYVLRGSVRKAGDQVRITAQLVNTATGYHIWAERYDRPLTDIFALQDEIVRQIVTSLAVRLKEGEQEQLIHTYTNNVEAYDSASRGWDYFYGYRQAANRQAQQLFQHALEIDPQYTVAYVGLGRTHWLDCISAWSQDETILEQAIALAQRAVTLDNTFPLVHALLGDLHLLKEQHAQAIAAAERAITLIPMLRMDMQC